MSSLLRNGSLNCANIPSGKKWLGWFNSALAARIAPFAANRHVDARQQAGSPTATKNKSKIAISQNRNFISISLISSIFPLPLILSLFHSLIPSLFHSLIPSLFHSLIPSLFPSLFPSLHRASTTMDLFPLWLAVLSSIPLKTNKKLHLNWPWTTQHPLCKKWNSKFKTNLWIWQSQ